MKLERYCSNCNKYLPLEHFSEKGKRGFTFHCIECRGEYKKKDPSRRLFMFNKTTLSRLVELAELYGVHDLILETDENHQIEVWVE